MPICEDCYVKLVGEDGNAFSIIGNVLKEMRKQKISKIIQSEFQVDSMSGDYNHLLNTCMKYVNVE